MPYIRLYKSVDKSILILSVPHTGFDIWFIVFDNGLLNN